MSIIIKERIPEFTEILSSKGMHLYHSCQLKDFESYLKLKGIPSRNLLEQSDNEFTLFETDDNDKENLVWDKVFVNLSDFGNYFARYAMNNPNIAPVPTVYGPISFEIHSNALNLSDDICVSLKSAGLEGYTREKFGISIENLPQIFECIDCPEPHKETFLKSQSELRRTFQVEEPGTLTPEINISIPNEIIPFDQVIQIRVDQIKIRGVKLINRIKEMLDFYQYSFHVSHRNYHYAEGEKRIAIKQKIATQLESSIPDAQGLANLFKGDEYGSDWHKRVIKGGLEYQQQRYMKYLNNGTVSHIK